MDYPQRVVVEIGLVVAWQSFPLSSLAQRKSLEGPLELNLAVEADGLMEILLDMTESHMEILQSSVL